MSKRKLDFEAARREREAILQGRSQLVSETAREILADTETDVPQKIQVRRIRRSPYQPRVSFKLASLEKLANNIRETNGLRQPIEVRPIDHPDFDFELLDGERRLQTFEKVLEWDEIDAFVRACDDHTAVVLATLANLQREDLSDYELARGVRTLLDSGAAESQRRAGAMIGCDEKAIRSMLKFFSLPAEVQSVLDIEPTLLSATTVEDVINLCSDGHVDIVCDAMNKAIESPLRGPKLVESIVRRISSTHGATTSKLMVRDIRNTDGRRICAITVRDKSLTLKIANGIDQTKLRELIEKVINDHATELESDAQQKQ